MLDTTNLTLTLFALGLIVVILLVLHHVRSKDSAGISVAEEFEFSSPQEAQRQKFLFLVAGLIKAATGLETRIPASQGQQHLDIEVYRGLRRVGVVSVITPGWGRPSSEHIRTIANIKDQKRVKTAYVVTSTTFTDKEKRLAKRLAVITLDGASLARIQRKAQAGAYVKKAAPPAEPSERDASRWRRPSSAPQPQPPVTIVKPDLDVTQKRKFPLPPWVEYR